MEFIDGYKITDVKSIENANLSKNEISNTLNRCFAEQVFTHGFLHCDPHPGNIFVRPIKDTSGWLGGNYVKP